MLFFGTRARNTNFEATLNHPFAAQVVGGLVFRRAAADCFEVSFLCVAASHGGIGVGSTLVDKLAALARRRRVARVVTHADEAAVSFWAEHGFAKAPVPKTLDKWINHYSASTFMALAP